ncbi:Prenylated rab acceptor PRA1 [Artemisia annua]|uniref:PRA1 family protein n=2 Tax=Artemisia annua TaxID=35608 RepID=A0A2U1MGU6_ARTAN|nr:Prenylated rab acceptor PRA1 [Artemisia annua]
MMAHGTMKAKAKTTAPSRIPQTTTQTATQWLIQPTLPPTNNNPDLRPFFSHMSASITQTFSQRRPWFELIDRSTFSRPDTFKEAVARVRKNLTYFRVNYTAIIVLVAAFSLLSHPFILFFLACLLWAWLFLYVFRTPDQPVNMFDRTFTDRETLGILIILTILIIFLTELGALMISSVVVGFGITCVHGAFRVPQEVFVDDQEPMNIGILSYITATAASGVVAATPTLQRV